MIFALHYTICISQQLSFWMVLGERCFLFELALFHPCLLSGPISIFARKLGACKVNMLKRFKSSLYIFEPDIVLNYTFSVLVRFRKCVYFSLVIIIVKMNLNLFILFLF